MSAEILRRAAALMRERAEAAPERFAYFSSSGHQGELERIAYIEANCCTTIEVEDSMKNAGEIAAHYMSWHPDVALAVADLLDAAADNLRQAANPDAVLRLDPVLRPALTVARAYLGEQQ